MVCSIWTPFKTLRGWRSWCSSLGLWGYSGRSSLHCSVRPDYNWDIEPASFPDSPQWGAFPNSILLCWVGRRACGEPSYLPLRAPRTAGHQHPRLATKGPSGQTLTPTPYCPETRPLSPLKTQQQRSPGPTSQGATGPACTHTETRAHPWPLAALLRPHRNPGPKSLTGKDTHRQRTLILRALCVREHSPKSTRRKADGNC